MAMGYSRADLMGNLGCDPLGSDGGDGQPWARFSLAVNHAWTGGDGERRQETYWFPVVAWGRVAETCRQLLRKGSWVFVSGRLQSRHWQDEEGEWHKTTEVVARTVILLKASEPEPDASEALEAS